MSVGRCEQARASARQMTRRALLQRWELARILPAEDDLPVRSLLRGIASNERIP